jgi:hypothetical protein
MGVDPLTFYLLLAALVAAGILYLALRPRVFRGREHREDLGRTDRTVRAELDPQVHDRGAGRGEPERPERPQTPGRPGPDNLTRFR